jgi:hypothetical protein
MQQEIKLTYHDTIVFYDLPLVFVCTDKNNDNYIFVYHEEKEKCISYAVYKSNFTNLSLMDLPDDYSDKIINGEFGNYWLCDVNKATDDFINFTLLEEDLICENTENK